MRPVRIIIAVVFTAAVAVTGYVAYSVSLHPSPAAAPAAATPAVPVPAAADSPRRTPQPAPIPRTPAAPHAPHFASPQASMRYLAAAYNRDALAALKHVTTPQARIAPAGHASQRHQPATGRLHRQPWPG